MLDSALKIQLKEYLERITQPVQLVASVDDQDSSGEMLDMLADIASLSTLISVEVVRGDAHLKPSFAVSQPGTEARIRFAGIPMGHEFTSLVLALLQVGGYPPKVDADVIEQIRALQGEFIFETFISLSCQLCPDVVQALNMMTVVNP